MPSPVEQQSGLRPAYEIDWDKIDDGELLAFVRHHYDTGKARRARWEAAASQQLAWVRGDQTVRVDPKTLQETFVEQTPDEDLAAHDRMPIVKNGLLGNVLSRIALTIRRAPAFHVWPITGDERDSSGARLAQQLLSWSYYDSAQPIRADLLEVLWMLFATGVVFPKIIWDPTAGALEPFGPRNLDRLNATGRNRALALWRERIEARIGHELTPAELRSLEDEGRIWLPQGEPRVEWRTGFDITEPPLCRRIGSAPWLIESVWVTLDDLAEEFGSEAVQEVERETDGDAYQTAWHNLYGGEASSQTPEGCLRHQLWIPRSLTHPGGYWAVVAGGAVLRRGEHPYKHGRLPFAELRELPDPRFRPTCTVANLIGLQDARNKLTSGAIWYAHRRLRSPVLVEDDSGLPDDAFEGDVPAKIICNPGSNLGRKALHFQYAPSPPELLNLDALMRVDMSDVAGVHDATTGRRESAQESGRHAALLQAADLARNTPTRELLNQGMSEVGAQILWLWWQYATSERALHITGDDAEADTLRFLGQSLSNKHQRPEWRVRVELGHAQEVADQVAQVEGLTRMGYMSPERASDRLLVRGLLRGQIADIGEEERRQRRRVASEHRALLAGDFGDVRVVEGDDDELHIALHRRWTLSDDYSDTLAQGIDDVRKALEVHVREHEFAQAHQLMRFKVLAASVEQVLKAHYRQETARRLAGLEGKAAGKPAATATPSPGPAAPPARRPLWGRIPGLNRWGRR